MRLKRSTGGCEYFAVPELHKTGKVHIHLLTNAMLKKKWWKDNAAACGFGYQSDAQEVVAVGGVASYVSKYLSKTLQFSNLPKATRRVRTSRGWPKLPEPEQQPGWQFTLLPKDAGMQDTAEVLMMRGYQVSIAGSKSAWKLLAATAEV